MPVSSLNHMILGFSVVFGILMIYAVSLFLRFMREKRTDNQQNRQD